ncbi:MAG: glycosyltransferase [Desulfococcaceae bacterium]
MPPHLPDPDAADSAPPAKTPIPFFLATGFFLLLCLWGGDFGHIGGVSLGFAGHSLPAGKFILLFVLTWLAHLVLLPLFPRNLSPRQSGRLLLVLALAARLALLPHPPSDDVNRYLWEGRLIVEGINPYHHPPADPDLSALAAADPFHAGINHPETPAAYPPVSLLLFAAAGWISYQFSVVKWLIIGFDLLCVVLILALLRRRALPDAWAVLYAFNPLVLYAFAGQAHLDAIQNAFLLAALVLYDRRRFGWMFVFLGLAVQSKFVAVLALPFLVRWDNLRVLPLFGLAVALPLLPFLDGGLAAVYVGLVRFGGDFAFNGPVHAPLRFWVFDGDMQAAREVCQLLLAAALMLGFALYHPEWSARHRDDPLTGVFFAMGALVLFSPTVHFWYLSWVLILLPLRPVSAWSLASLTAAAYFVAVGISHATGRWRLSAAAQFVEWLPPGLLLVRAFFLELFRLRSPKDTAPPRWISVVIPAVNEARRIGDCVSAVRGSPGVGEIIVVDGGSSDGTAEAARTAGARVLIHAQPPHSGGGRGGQLRAGVLAATGDVVAIVHADTRTTAHTFTRISEALRRNPSLVGGAYGGLFGGTGWRLRALEFANDLRAAWGVSFGDQVQFFRRRPMVQADLFPDLPLMEDVELSLRMQRLGRVTFLFGDARISARRWTAGLSRRGGLVVRLVATYFFRRLWGTPDTVGMFRRYYETADQKITANRDRPD